MIEKSTFCFRVIKQKSLEDCIFKAFSVVMDGFEPPTHGFSVRTTEFRIPSLSTGIVKL